MMLRGTRSPSAVLRSPVSIGCVTMVRTVTISPGAGVRLLSQMRGGSVAMPLSFLPAAAAAGDRHLAAVAEDLPVAHPCQRDDVLGLGKAQAHRDISDTDPR